MNRVIEKKWFGELPDTYSIYSLLDSIPRRLRRHSGESRSKTLRESRIWMSPQGDMTNTSLHAARIIYFPPNISAYRDFPHKMFDSYKSSSGIDRNFIISAACLSHRSTAASRNESEHCVASTAARIPIGIVSFRATCPYTSPVRIGFDRRER